MDPADAWDDNDDWELNDAPALAAAPAAATAEPPSSSEEEEEDGRREPVCHKGVAGSRAGKTALELKMEARDARNVCEAADAAALLAIGRSEHRLTGEYTGSAAFDEGDNSLTDEQRRKAKLKASRDSRHAKARAFLKDGQLRGLDADARTERASARTYDTSTACGTAGGPLWREEDASDEVIPSASSRANGKVATADAYMGGRPMTDASLASGRVVNANAAGIATALSPAEPPPGVSCQPHTHNRGHMHAPAAQETRAREDKTQRASKKQQARQRELQRAAEAERVREEAAWQVGAKPGSS